MKVGFNARLLSAPDLRGWNRYTRNLLAALADLGVELVLYTDRPIHPAHRARLPDGHWTERIGAVRPYARWEQAWLPRQCRRDAVSLLHAPANFGLPWSSPCPRVLTLHDAIDQVYYAPREPFRKRWSVPSVRSRLAHWVARTRAERVITVSEHARGDLVERLGLDASRIHVIHEAADPVFLEPIDRAERDSVRARHGLGRPYVFYVGGWEARKNLPFLVRAFADCKIAGIELVLAGGRDEQRAGLADLASALDVGDRVRLLGWVEDADLPALYAEALCLAYPSEYEGFGLQLCEAMAVGCPSLAARATCLPEVLGNGGETFGLESPHELMGLLSRVATDPAYRAALSDCARLRSADFSWPKAAEATLAVYRELVGNQGLSEGGIVGSARRSQNSLEGLRDVRNLSKARLQRRADTCGLYAGASVLKEVGPVRGLVDFSRVRGQIRANRATGRGVGLESLELESFLGRNVEEDVAVLGMNQVTEPQLPGLLGRGHVIAHVDGNHWVRISGVFQDAGSTWVRIYDPARGSYEQLLSSFMTRAGQGNRMILVIP